MAHFVRFFPTIVLGLVLSLSAAAEACKCRLNISDAQHFAEADTVFTGVVTRAKSLNTSRFPPTETTFTVLESSKSAVVGSSVTIYQLGFNCDISFEPGSKCVVYASKRDGKLTTSACSGTRSSEPRKLPPVVNTFTLKVGEDRFTAGPSVRLVRIHDRRCPIDVHCLWAGVLGAELEVRDGNTKKTYFIGFTGGRSVRLGKDFAQSDFRDGPVVLGDSEIYLIDVKPGARAEKDAELPQDQYELAFKWLPIPLKR